MIIESIKDNVSEGLDLWINPALNSELMATPIHGFRIDERIFEMNRIITVVRMAKKNADIVVRYGLFITTTSAMLLPVVPAPKSRMPIAAPNAAELDKPRVNVETSVLRKTITVIKRTAWKRRRSRDQPRQQWLLKPAGS